KSSEWQKLQCFCHFYHGGKPPLGSLRSQIKGIILAFTELKNRFSTILRLIFPSYDNSNTD
ncbi:hypothetical protein, partial [Streptococcus mutans]|uniref:hypothetical protein n=1 Tax=Streptococcus mutans TaxID=1309 RepID=UPI001EE71811